ncbi:MAG: hypothetical protein U0361_09605 [Nitrospiraceae bacterium]
MTLPQPRVLQKLDGAPWDIEPYLKARPSARGLAEVFEERHKEDIVGEIKPACGGVAALEPHRNEVGQGAQPPCEGTVLRLQRRRAQAGNVQGP